MTSLNWDRFDAHAEQLTALTQTVTLTLKVLRSAGEQIDLLKQMLDAERARTENLNARLELYEAHSENLIARMAEVEDKLGYGPDNDEALSPCDVCLGEGAQYPVPEGRPCANCKGLGQTWTAPWV